MSILVYSYLLPLVSLLFIKKDLRTRKDVVVVVIYGIVFFLLLNFQRYFKDYAFWDKIQDYFFGFYTFLEFLFFSILYLFNIKTKTFKILAAILFILFIIFQIFYLQTVDAQIVDNLPVGIETLVMFVYIFYFFYTRFQNIDDQYIYNHHGFWISVGIMLYLGGSFFLYILGNHISKEEVDNYWYFTYITETIKNIFFAISVVVYARESKDTISKHLPNLDFN